MSTKDWVDVINSTIANIIALVLLIWTIRRRPRHKK